MIDKLWFVRKVVNNPARRPVCKRAPGRRSIMGLVSIGGVRPSKHMERAPSPMGASGERCEDDAGGSETCHGSRGAPGHRSVLGLISWGGHVSMSSAPSKSSRRLDHSGIIGGSGGGRGSFIGSVMCHVVVPVAPRLGNMMTINSSK